jgi:hypothetical protein
LFSYRLKLKTVTLVLPLHRNLMGKDLI